MSYARRDAVTVAVHAAPQTLFDHLDDQTRLGVHMEKPSMMMMGGRMTYEFDAMKGRAVGSVIRMGGGFLGINLFAEEVVVERTPPTLKVWETRGRPRLVIVGAYRMGFEITPASDGSQLRVFIDYDLPRSLLGKILGFLFAPAYARWCVERMAKDARSAFSVPAAVAAA